MELDQRVKALEYEMKILKNEIQHTLLDIQEQVLVHYYPTLRAEDSMPPAEAIAQSATRAAAAASAAPSAAAPVLKKVSLDEIRATPLAAVPMPGGSVDQATMVKLLEWVNDTLVRPGSKRTSRLIETCVARTILDNDTKAILLRLTSLNQQPDPAVIPANDSLTIVLRRDEVLDRSADIDEALTGVEGAGPG